MIRVKSTLLSHADHSSDMCHNHNHDVFCYSCDQSFLFTPTADAPQHVVIEGVMEMSVVLSHHQSL